MLTLYENIKKIRTERGLSQQELAEKSGYTDRSSIAKIESGKVDLTQSKIKAIAKALGITSAELLDEPALDFSPSLTQSFVTYPVIGEIAAGYNNIALENWSGDTVEIPQSYLKGHKKDDFFVLEVKGNSMYPDYREGDKVLILKQPSLDYSGQVGAVIYDDEISTLKKVEFNKGEDWLRLVPINPSVPPIEISGERIAHCKVLGVPRLLLREFK